MLPRGKLLALIAIVVAASMVAGSGAFSVAAERKATVEIAGDKSALLGLQASDKTGGQYAKQTGSGEMEITIGKNNEGAKGINPDSVTSIDHVFNVSNNGKTKVDVYISSVNTNGSSGKLTFYNPENGEKLTKDNAKTLSSGSSMSIGVRINAKGLTKSDDFTADYIIHADDPTSSTKVSYNGNSGSSSSDSSDNGTSIRVSEGGSGGV